MTSRPSRPYTSLQDWLERTGTTQTRLAELVQMPKSQLSQLLTGSRRCSVMKALALSKVTGVPVENLTAWPKIPFKRTYLAVSAEQDT